MTERLIPASAGTGLDSNDGTYKRKIKVMSKKEFLLLLVIFIFALILRLGYILPISPSVDCLWSDEGSYNATALSMHNVLSHFNIVVREFFSGGLGKGEGALNTYGIRLPIGIFYRCGIINTLLIAVTYLLFGINNFKAVWIVYGVLGSISPLLVYAMGKRIFTGKIAICASILIAIYLPFIEYTATLSQETLIIFLLLVTLTFFVKAIQEKSKMTFLLGGFSLFLVTTGRVAYMYWFIILLVCLAFIFIKEKSALLLRKALFGLTLGFFIPLLLWMGLVSLESGKFGNIRAGQDGIMFHRSNVISLEGWLTDEDRDGYGPHMREKLKEAGFSWDEKNEKWLPNAIAKKATWNEIRSNPRGFLSLVVYRMKLLWFGKACDANDVSSFK